jgi:hypothetical protein
MPTYSKEFYTMTENPTLRLRRLLLIMAAGGNVRDDVLREAEREAQLHQDNSPEFAFPCAELDRPAA